MLDDPKLKESIIKAAFRKQAKGKGSLSMVEIERLELKQRSIAHFESRFSFDSTHVTQKVTTEDDSDTVPLYLGSKHGMKYLMEKFVYCKI